MNWPQNDYLLGPIAGPGITPEDARRHIARAKQLSLSLLYWLQTECPRPDGKLGWKGLKLRPDLVGTDDGLAKAPYIRESRRILAEFTVLEQHVGTEARRSKTKTADPQAEPFPDSVGVGSYRIDLHPSTGGDNYIDISSLPFQVPLGAVDPAAGREPAAGLQGPGDDPHHQRLLPAAPGRVGHRRGRRRAGGHLPGA